MQSKEYTKSQVLVLFAILLRHQEIRKFHIVIVWHLSLLDWIYFIENM